MKFIILLMTLSRTVFAGQDCVNCGPESLVPVSLEAQKLFEKIPKFSMANEIQNCIEVNPLLHFIEKMNSDIENVSIDMTLVPDGEAVRFQKEYSLSPGKKDFLNKYSQMYDHLSFGTKFLFLKEQYRYSLQHFAENEMSPMSVLEEIKKDHETFVRLEKLYSEFEHQNKPALLAENGKPRNLVKAEISLLSAALATKIRLLSEFTAYNYNDYPSYLKKAKIKPGIGCNIENPAKMSEDKAKLLQQQKKMTLNKSGNQYTSFAFNYLKESVSHLKNAYKSLMEDKTLKRLTDNGVEPEKMQAYIDNFAAGFYKNPPLSLQSMTGEKFDVKTKQPVKWKKDGDKSITLLRSSFLP